MKRIILNRDNFILDLSRDKNVLHIGACNSPFTEQSFNDGSMLYKKIDGVCNKQLGIDLDEESIAFLEKQNLKNSTVIKGNMNDSLNTEFDADIIIFGETLEHLMNLGIALESIREMMQTDTQLFISVPNAFYIRNFIYALFGKEWQHPDHKVAFTTKTLQALLTETKFTSIDVNYGYSMDFSGMNMKGKISMLVAVPISYVFPRLSANLIVTCKKL